MYEINDCVVHNSGVCQIVDIRKESDINGAETEYYVLQPVYGNPLTIKSPVNNPKGVIRRVVTRDEVLALIAAMPEQETFWPDNNKERNAAFKDSIKSGQNEEWVKVIKSVYLKKEAEPGAVSKADDQYMKTAERQLHEEFSVALGITPEEVLPYIQSHIPRPQTALDWAMQEGADFSEES